MKLKFIATIAVSLGVGAASQRLAESYDIGD